MHEGAHFYRCEPRLDVSTGEFGGSLKMTALDQVVATDKILALREWAIGAGRRSFVCADDRCLDLAQLAGVDERSLGRELFLDVVVNLSELLPIRTFEGCYRVGIVVKRQQEFQWTSPSIRWLICNMQGCHFDDVTNAASSTAIGSGSHEWLAPGIRFCVAPGIAATIASAAVIITGKVS